MDLLDIKNITENELADWLERHAIARYRARQIFGWVYHRGVENFLEMTDLSKTLRHSLKNRLTIGRLEPERIVSSKDGSRKYLFRLKDGQAIESVLIPERGHRTLCVSSQVGCAMACRFCLTGQKGLIRNLETGEIINQVCAVKRTLFEKDRLTNLVFMGMGEPLANYENVVKALHVLTNDYGLQFSNRRVTVSTAGLAPKIADLGGDTRVSLAVSLNAVDNQTRTRLMPINRTYPIEKLLRECARFPLPNRRMITVEYVLLRGVNDSEEEARRLARLLRPLRAKINLIPFNLFENAPFRSPKEEQVLAFQNVLLQQGYTTIVRRSKGRDIGAACGQLRAQAEA